MRLLIQESMFSASSLQLALMPKPRPEGSRFVLTWVKMMVLVEKCNQVSVTRTRVLLEVNCIRTTLMLRKPT